MGTALKFSATEGGAGEAPPKNALAVAGGPENSEVADLKPDLRNGLAFFPSREGGPEPGPGGRGPDGGGPEGGGPDGGGPDEGRPDGGGPPLGGAPKDGGC